MAQKIFDERKKAELAILLEELKARYAEINMLNTQIGTVYTLSVSVIGFTVAAVGVGAKSGDPSVREFLYSNISRLVSASISCVFISLLVLKDNYSGRMIRQARYIDNVLRKRLTRLLGQKKALFLDYEHYAQISRLHVIKHHIFVKYFLYENMIMGVPFAITIGFALIGAIVSKRWIELSVYLIIAFGGSRAWISTGKVISAPQTMDGVTPPAISEGYDMSRPLTALRRLAITKYLIKVFNFDVRFNLKELNKPIYLQGTRSSEEIARRSYKAEASVTSKIIELIKLGKFTTFIDVGANVGFFSWLVEEQDNDINIIAIEPEIRNMNTMLKSAQMRNSKVMLIRAALSDRTGSVLFFPDEVTGKTGSTEFVYGDQSYAEKFFRQKRKEENVPSLTFNEISEFISSSTLIKIDIEGGESRAFRGSLDILINKRPTIIVEINRNNQDEMFRIFRDVGYKYEPISKPGLLDRDYLAMPSE